MATQAPPYDDDAAGRVDATYDGMGKQACFGADTRGNDDGDKAESGPRPTTQTTPVQKVQYEVGESSKANEVDGQETAREPKPARPANRTRRSSRSAPKSREMSRTAQWLKELFQAPKPDKPAVQRNRLKKKRRVEKQVDGSATGVDKSAEVSTPGAQSDKGHVEEPVAGASTPGTVSTRGVASSSRAGGSTRGLGTLKEAAPVDAAVSSDRGSFGSNKGTEATPSEPKGAETTTDRGWFFGESVPEPTESKDATTTAEPKDTTTTTTTDPKDAATTTTTESKDAPTTTTTESKNAAPSTTDEAPQAPVGSTSSPTDSKNATPTTAESTRGLFGSDAAPKVSADSTPMPTEPNDATTTDRGLFGSKTDDSPEDKDTSTDKADDRSVPDGVREGVEEAIEKIEQILQVILDYLSSMGRPALTDRVSQQLRTYLDNVERATRGLPIDNEEKTRGLPTDNGTVTSKAGSVGTRDLVSKAGSVGTRDLSAESDRMVPKIQPDVDGPGRESVPGIELGEGGSGWFGGSSHGAESVGTLQEPGSSRGVPLTPGFVPMGPEQGPDGYPAEDQGGRYSEGRSGNGVPLAGHDEARGFEGHETGTDGYTDDSDSEFDGEQILVRLSDCMSPIGTEVLRRWMQDRLEQALEENVGIDEMVVDEEGLLSWGDAETSETDGETDEG